jgi:pyruvate,water dikinase
VEVLCHGDRDQALAQIHKRPQLQGAFAAYLDRFGDRCLEELKLESPTLADDPLPLLRAIGQLARGLALGEAVETLAAAQVRRDAESQASDALRGRPLRKIVFNWILRRTRRHVRDRENLRFERTRVFGRVRRLFVEIGRRLFAEGLLDDPRDVFYLDLEEVLGFVEGTITCPDLQGLAATRKTEFQRYRSLSPPASRCETRGAVHVGNDFSSTRTAAAAHKDRSGDQTVLQGTGCCRGVVRGPVRIVRDPRDVTLGAGQILVAEQTDPGWVLLFPAAAGVLIQRGSLLSHSAVLARELGIPTIVAIAGLMSRLQDGDRVEMDGTTGTVRVVEPVAVAFSRRAAESSRIGKPTQASCASSSLKFGVRSGG